MKTGVREVCLFLLIIIYSWNLVNAAPKKIVCYYTNWAQYRTGIGRYTPDDIQSDLCTHIIFAFAKVAQDPETKEYTQLLNFEWNDLAMYKKVTALKSPGVKVLLAVGGWTHGVWLFNQMASKKATRKTFIKNAIAFLRKHNFDGLDYDWEYPKSDSKEKFAALVQETRKFFEEEGQDQNKERLIVSAAIAPLLDVIDDGYDIPLLAENLDFINVMAYDLHSYRHLSHHSPMDKQKETIKHLQSLGAPASKLILGIATYGRSYTMSGSSLHGMGDVVTGAGKPGVFTKQGGILAYYEVCTYRKDSDWQKEVHPTQQVPYGWLGYQWVGFDDVKSVGRKANYTCTEQLGGVMIWTLDFDDFTGGSCGEGRYPLVRAAKDVLSKPSCSEETEDGEKL